MMMTLEERFESIENARADEPAVSPSLWLLRSFAGVVFCFGLVVFAGSLWLVDLGVAPGWHVAVGVGFLLTSWCLCRRSFAAVPLCALTWLGAVAATVMTLPALSVSAELGRLVLPTLILGLVFVATPLLIDERT